MSRVEQLQAAKFSGMAGKSAVFKDFPRQAGLDAQELPGEHRLEKGCEPGRLALMKIEIDRQNENLRIKKRFSFF